MKHDNLWQGRFGTPVTTAKEQTPVSASRVTRIMIYISDLVHKCFRVGIDICIKLPHNFVQLGINCNGLHIVRNFHSQINQNRHLAVWNQTFTRLCTLWTILFLLFYASDRPRKISNHLYIFTVRAYTNAKSWVVHLIFYEFRFG